MTPAAPNQQQQTPTAALWLHRGIPRQRCRGALAGGEPGLEALRKKPADKIGAGASGSPAEDAADASETQPKRAIVCAACGHSITDTDARPAHAGRHHHTCVNPAGIVYRIGCFRSAPGCVGVGEWSTYWSWFEGYAWQVSCCQGCSIHLGWGFQGDGGPFFGLILERLDERES